MNNLGLSYNRSVGNSEQSEWTYNDLLLIVEQAHRLHTVYASIVHAAREVQVAKIKCSRPEAGAPQPPDIISAPLHVHVALCNQLAEHLKAAIPVSHQAHALFEEVSFGHLTGQTISA